MLIIGETTFSLRHHCFCQHVLTTGLKMTANLIILCLILATKQVYTQFGSQGIQPDVKFDAGNDRFDITSMIHDTNKVYNHQVLRAREEDEDDDIKETEDNRRNMKSEEEGTGVLESLTSDKVRKSGRRLDFAYHDKMNSNEGGNVQEYEQNLKHFLSVANLRASEGSARRMMDYVKHLHGSQEQGRRTGSSNNEQDVLLHYAAPFQMEIDGYMKVPLH